LNALFWSRWRGSDSHRGGKREFGETTCIFVFRVSEGKACKDFEIGAGNEKGMGAKIRQKGDVFEEPKGQETPLRGFKTSRKKCGGG